MRCFRFGCDNCALFDEKEITDGIGILPYCFCPHCESESWQRFNNVVSGRPCSAIACENNCAVCFTDGGCSLFRCADAATVYYYDDGVKKYDLGKHSEVLMRL